MAFFYGSYCCEPNGHFSPNATVWITRPLRMRSGTNGIRLRPISHLNSAVLHWDSKWFTGICYYMLLYVTIYVTIFVHYLEWTFHWIPYGIIKIEYHFNEYYYSFVLSPFLASLSAATATFERRPMPAFVAVSMEPMRPSWCLGANTVAFFSNGASRGFD